MRRRLFAIPFALTATLALATTVLAGGWAQVTVTDAPVDPPAGSATTIDLKVLQHGETAVSWPRITVVGTNGTTGDVVRTEATAEGAEGHYLATITFPVEGSWSLAFESPDLIMEGAGTLVIAVAPSAPIAGEVASTTAAFDPATGFVGVALVVLIVGLLVFGLRGRRSEPTTVSS